MTDKSETYHKDAFIVANASIFRSGAKITYLQMIHIIIGFAHGALITVCSGAATTHRDTVRDIYEALRARLFEARFDQWVQSDYASLHRGAEEDAALMAEAKDALFGCHENTECLKRYRAGRRKARVCRACSIQSYVRYHEGADEQIEGLVEIIDFVRDFYRQLGWKETITENNDHRTIFDKRFRHYEIFSTAVSHSEFDDAGKVISTEDDFLSIRHLAKALTQELKEHPLGAS